MKLAWICYDIGWEKGDSVTIVFEHPDPWMWATIIPIVYAEIER
jgi:hypothetical protein